MINDYTWDNGEISQRSIELHNSTACVLILDPDNCITVI